MNSSNLSRDEYDLIWNNYIHDRRYLILLGNNDYAESFITAEWLYDSMQKARAIDLTVIGLGYFKCIEQLIYSIICLHKNEDREIKKVNSKLYVPLNDLNIDGKNIDTSLGAMANFIKRNMDIFDDNLTYRSKEYVREAIFSYKDVRNGYSHKDNIYDWNEIERIRSKSIYLMFLLMGSLSLSIDQLKKLGYPDRKYMTDYYKLCEYINYHRDEFFVLEMNNKEDLFISCVDLKKQVVDDNYVKYSGVYFRDIGQNSRTYHFTEKNLPKVISLAKLAPSGENGVSFTPTIVKRIYENNKFIGPLVSEEEGFDY